MVHVMGSLRSEIFEDFFEEEYGSLPKRTRFEAAPSNQFQPDVAPPQYSPLDEPSPLGLRLRKSVSLLDLIQTALSQRSSGSISSNPTEHKNDTGGSATDKLKASNFPASLLRIGSWEYVSKYEGDLVAKCYFAKHKLVWEVLDGGLKSKIEIQWSDITALKADLPDDGPGALTVMLARQPAFFRETNPQPRKHTLWQATTDFTDGQATKNKQHFLQCPPGILNKHYEKLIQCDMRLGILSQQPEIVLESPYFKTHASVPEEYAADGGHAAKGSPVSAFEEAASKLGNNPLAFQCVSKEEEAPSSAAMVEGFTKGIKHDPRGANIPWLGPSMSMSDLVNHIGCMPSAKASECHDMLESISQDLLSDNQSSMGLDERSLMKKVNSLCSLLQETDNGVAAAADPATKNVYTDLVNDSEAPGEDGLPRKDSFSDLLLQLPTIASLPKFPNFLHGIAEGDEYWSP